MANVNSPTGFHPIGHLSGGEIPEPKEFIVTADAVIYKGDPVIVTSAGTITVAAAGDTTIHLGIAAEFIPTTATHGSTCKVYVDPSIIYEVQANAALTQASVFGSGDIITYAAGDATTKQSKMALDTLGTSSKPWLVIGLVERPSNAWGAYQKVKVISNSGIRMTSYAGI